MRPSKHSKCPCGSGKKFLKCCWNREVSNGLTYSDFLKIQHNFKVIRQKEEAYTQYWNDNFGSVKKFVNCEAGDDRYIAVAGKIFAANKHHTVHDFLLDYIDFVIGEDWFNDNPDHPLSQLKSHFIHNFYCQHSGCKNHTIVETKLDSFMAYFFCICYDVYILRHHQKLQEKLINRIKGNPIGFLGARYEMLVIATFIRADFSIAFENEDDRSSSHVEFIATDNINGQQFAIECKTLTRNGVTDFSWQKREFNIDKLKVSKRLTSALNKKPDLPYIVFYELNIPKNNKSLHQLGVAKKFINALARIHMNKRAETGLMNRVFITNFSPYYENEIGIFPARDTCYVDCDKPRFEIKDVSSIDRIGDSVLRYSYIPTKFPTPNWTHD